MEEAFPQILSSLKLVGVVTCWMTASSSGEGKPKLFSSCGVAAVGVLVAAREAL